MDLGIGVRLRVWGLGEIFDDPQLGGDDSEVVVYGNGFDQRIGGGNIKVHKG